jgi:hypothetical protein
MLTSCNAALYTLRWPSTLFSVSTIDRSRSLCDDAYIVQLSGSQLELTRCLHRVMVISTLYALLRIHFRPKLSALRCLHRATSSTALSIFPIGVRPSNSGILMTFSHCILFTSYPHAAARGY